MEVIHILTEVIQFLLIIWLFLWSCYISRIIRKNNDTIEYELNLIRKLIKK